MAICTHCGGEMTEWISCKSDPIRINGSEYEPIRWGSECQIGRRRAVPEHCQDCGTPIGGVHHPGCCEERCPVCFGQAFGCPCFEGLECPREFENPSFYRYCAVHILDQQRRR